MVSILTLTQLLHCGETPTVSAVQSLALPHPPHPPQTEASFYSLPSLCLLQSLENSGDQSHKMPTDRCVRLTLVSTANDLKEAWISDHPYLAVCYLWQYAPTWAWWLMNRMGKRRIQNFKSGVVSLFLSPPLTCVSLPC